MELDQIKQTFDSLYAEIADSRQRRNTAEKREAGIVAERDRLRAENAALRDAVTQAKKSEDISRLRADAIQVDLDTALGKLKLQREIEKRMTMTAQVANA